MKILEILEEGREDGRVGGSWAYLVLGTQQDNNCYVTTTSENDPNTGRTDLLQLFTERPHQKG